MGEPALLFEAGAALIVERALMRQQAFNFGTRIVTDDVVEVDLSRRPFVVPIPGTSHVHRLEENAAAAGLRLSADTEDALAHIFAPGAAAGDRYPANHLQRLMI